MGQTKIVVQCKHYRGSTFSELKRAARQEKPKMDREAPDEYYFVTSQDLSITQKDTLVDALEPHISDSSQVLGQRDLNQLLTDFPEVEINHFKLWMASVGVIKRIVQSGIWERSSALMEEVQDRVRLYVHTTSFAVAQQVLSDKRVCVITGAPGVGKSMLGDMLALTYWEEGWQIVPLASHEISKCWDAWTGEAKQLFYFDDVFGQTDIQERLSNDSGATLARLIRRVGASDEKRLVITTRTHILREAELRDEPIERAGLRARECVVQVQDYKKIHRAHILYNHLYFSDLDRGLIQDFVSKKVHLRIVEHANFTPRLIEQTIRQEESGISPGPLATRMLNALNHPVLLWGPSFREALSEPARTILMHLASFPTSGAPMAELRTASKREASPIEYRRAIAQLEGSWIRIAQGIPALLGLVVTFHDPSCRDFVLAFLDSEPEYVADVLNHATDGVQLAQILAYARPSRTNVELKYPGLDSAIRHDPIKIAGLVRAAWERGSDQQQFVATEILQSLLESSSVFDLHIDGWIADQVLRLPPVLSRYHYPDADSIRALTDLLKTSHKVPTTVEEFDSCRQLFQDWCQCVTEESEWDHVLAFKTWVEECVGYRPDSADEEAFRDSFEQWLDSEFDAILDSVDGRDPANGWVNHLEVVSQRYFSWTQFESAFQQVRVRINEKWNDNYEPDDTDYRAMRSSQAVERGRSEPSSKTRLINAINSMTEAQRTDREIGQMFTQLS